MTLDCTTSLREQQKVIPRQKVINVKLKDNQFIPLSTTVSNKENFSQTQNILAKLGGYSTTRNQQAPMPPPKIKEPLSTKNQTNDPFHNRIPSQGALSTAQQRISLTRVEFVK